MEYTKPWLSLEQFVAHFWEKYKNRMPAWALTETLELGQLSILYRGLHQKYAEEIAVEFGVEKPHVCPAPIQLTRWFRRRCWTPADSRMPFF